MQYKLIDNKSSIDVLLSRKEIDVILKSFLFIEIGLEASQYIEYLQVDEKYVDKLIQCFSEIKNISLNKENKNFIRINTITDNEVCLTINEIELRAIYGSLINLSFWISENDISSIIGIGLDEFITAKKEIIFVIRNIKKYDKENKD
jgi:hypothetical protein